MIFFISESSNRPSNTTGRRTSSSSITSESVKKARQVYCAKQPKPRYYSAGVTLNSSHNTTTGNQIKPNQNSSNSSSMTSLRCGSVGGDQEGDEANVTQPASKKESINNNENSNQQNHSRTMSLSPMKRSNNNNIKNNKISIGKCDPSPQKGHQSLKSGGPKIAKPVIKPQLKIPSGPHSNKNNTLTSHKRPEQQSNRKLNSYNKNSSRLPLPPSSSSISSGAASPSISSSPIAGISKAKSPSMLVSRIPQPGSNSQSPLKKSRIPSAPKYNPPQRKVYEDILREALPTTPSPPPPPPPSEMMQQEETKVSNIAVGRCSPSSTPTPTPPDSPLLMEHDAQRMSNNDGMGNEDEDDDILCVHPDGQVEIRPSSSSRASTTTPSTAFHQQTYGNNKNADPSSDRLSQTTNTSPWKPVPEPSNYQPPTYSSSARKISSSTDEKTTNNLKPVDTNIHEDSSGYSGGENASSADDEGSRDGEEEEEDGRRRSSLSGTRYSMNSKPGIDMRDSIESNDNLLPASMNKPPRKVDNKQGIAARRIQRTWKHFYQEVNIC